MTLWAMRAGPGGRGGVLPVAGSHDGTAGGVSGADYGLIALIAIGDLLANLFFAIASTLGYLSITSVLSSLYRSSRCCSPVWCCTKHCAISSCRGSP